MPNDFFQPLREIGFSDRLLQSITQLLPTVGTRFTISERKLLGDNELKFVALLYYNKEKGLMPLRYCHVIDVSPSHFFDRSHTKEPTIQELDESLRAIDFNSPIFIQPENNNRARDLSTIVKAYHVCDKLKPTNDLDPVKIVLKQMLLEKYIRDTIFGQQKLVFEGTARRYDPLFPTLTLSNETGFLSMTNAAELVLKKGLSNANTEDEIKLGVQSFQRSRKSSTKRIAERPASKRRGREL